MAMYYETITIILLFCYIKSTWTQNKCIYSQYVTPGQQYRLNNPSFPYPYPAGTDCSWFFSTANDYEVQLNCHTVNLPINGQNCMDFLAVSTFGKTRQDNAYCHPFNVSGSTIRMRLASTFWSWGGVFSCGITANRIGTITPQPIENCSCGWTFMPRIVGGNDATINEFPSMALLVYVPIRDQWCGATIIARRAALSAAHCFDEDADAKHYGLLIGEHDTSRRNETNSVLLKVSDIIVHKDATLTAGNDIALVITETEIDYTAKVGPACLPFSIDKQDIIGQYVTIAGWGRTDPIGPPAKILQKARVQIVEDSVCEKTYEEIKVYNPQQHICTYYPGKDACQMDSGGPVYYFDPQTNGYTIMGIISYGKDCGFFPAINMDVHYYLPWIRQNLPSDLQLCGRL